MKSRKLQTPEFEDMKKNKPNISVKLSKSDYIISEACIDYDNCELPDWYRHVEQIRISPGITLFIVDKPVDNEIRSKFKIENSPLEFSFCLKGTVTTEIHKTGYKKECFQVADNECSISYTPFCSGVSVLQNGGAYQSICICMDTTVLRMFFEKQDYCLLSEFVPILTDMDSKPIYRIEKTPAIMQAAVTGIFNCRFSEPMRKLYISSKVYELINITLSELLIRKSSSSNPLLSPKDIGQTIIAGNLLKDNLKKPPTVAELARQVNLSETRLKSGFKEVYGTTVYGYLQHEKMEKAKKHLDSGFANVSEVAWKVGYANVSHFIAAFRKHFGINPGQYLLHIKRSTAQQVLTQSHR